MFNKSVCVAMDACTHAWSVTAVVMRKIYPLGSFNETQSTWLLMSSCSIRELKDLTETADNQNQTPISQ